MPTRQIIIGGSTGLVWAASTLIAAAAGAGAMASHNYFSGTLVCLNEKSSMAACPPQFVCIMEEAKKPSWRLHWVDENGRVVK